MARCHDVPCQKRNWTLIPPFLGALLGTSSSTLVAIVNKYFA